MRGQDLETQRFLLKNLGDLSHLDQYLSWMQNESTYPFIESSDKNYTEEKLREYIAEIDRSSSAISYSILVKTSSLHIGNIKFHDIASSTKTCFVGFLIGNVDWQNQGVAKEVFLTCSQYLNSEFKIHKFYLGVSKSHTQAISAYKKMGFKIDKPRSKNAKDSLTMSFRLNS